MTDAEEPVPLSKELTKAIREEAVRQGAIYAVGAVIALSGIAVAGWILYLKDNIPPLVNGVPRGAVASFDLGACPSGWQPFDDGAGRFIIGTGQGTGLKHHPMRQVSGDEEHKLIRSELPPQALTIPNLARQSPTDKYDVPGGKVYSVSVVSGSFEIGGTGNPIDMLPPFIALRYCSKR
jgi:hypothetical protein